MSERDKKLLVYLGAIVIVAAAYFLVGKPFLDKIDAADAEETNLRNELRVMQEAYANRDNYENQIIEAEEKNQKILDEFPADITDEKSIMFLVNAEKEVPMWFSQIKFADHIEEVVDQNAESADSSEDLSSEEEASEDNTESSSSDNGYTSYINGLSWKRTDIGLSFQTQYDGFKEYLELIRDYDERLVVKEIDVEYDDYTGIVSGTMSLSQYALIGDDRELPPVDTEVSRIGNSNIFTNNNYGGTVLDYLSGMMSNFIEAITSNSTSAASAGNSADYFIQINAANDNTNAFTIGRAGDVAGESYVTSNENAKENIMFEVTGSEGKYEVAYTINGKGIADTVEESSLGSINLRIISSEKLAGDDEVEASISINNNSDVSVIVSIEGDDENEPRVNIASRNGDVTIR